jgi:hypothetical protein
MDYRQKYPEHFAASQDLPEGTPIQQAVALSEERNERIGELGKQFETDEIDGRTYGENRSVILMEIAARRNEIPPSDYKPKTDEEKAMDVYFRALDDARSASPTGILTFEEFEAAETKVRKELGPELSTALDSALIASADPVEREYLTDRLEFERGGYWDAEDLIWKSMRDSLPELAKYDTFDDFEKSLVDMAVEQGIPRDFIVGTDMMGSFPIVEQFRQMRADFRDFLINQNPKLGRLGLKWGWIARVRKGTAPVLFGE